MLASTPFSKQKSFLRWAGGKQWICDSISRFAASVSYKTYYEPFLGGGSVFFTLKPKKSFISDIDSDLINAYMQVMRSPEKIAKYLASLPVNRESYYEIRSRPLRTKLEKATKLIYLNRTCFNGLYRKNQLGQFNVPFGDRQIPADILDGTRLKDVSKLLRTSEILCCDFESPISRATAGDLVFCDPAYTVSHNNNGFIRYNEAVFSWDDQIRLMHSCKDAYKRGATVIVTNAAHPSIAALYHPFQPIVHSRSSSIAAKAGRGHYREYIFVLDKRTKVKRILADILFE